MKIALVGYGKMGHAIEEIIAGIECADVIEAEIAPAARAVIA